tara:strand:- start:130941 stop:131675 length:735 start_codon:yes stop_codon:yes gene_type:complete
MGNTLYFVIFNIKNKYEGTILSYLWTLVPIVMQFVIMSFITKQVFNQANDSSIRLFVSLLLWSFFREVTSNSSNLISFKWHHAKNYFIKLTSIIRIEFLSSVLIFGINLFFTLSYFALRGTYEYDILGLIYYILLGFLITYIISIFLFVLGSVYKDAFHLWNNFLSLLFWSVPIVYSSSLVPHKYLTILKLNPLFSVFSGLGDALNGEGITYDFNLLFFFGLIIMIVLCESLVERLRNSMVLRL